MEKSKCDVCEDNFENIDERCPEVCDKCINNTVICENCSKGFDMNSYQTFECQICNYCCCIECSGAWSLNMRWDEIFICSSEECICEFKKKS